MHTCEHPLAFPSGLTRFRPPIPWPSGATRWHTSGIPKPRPSG